ncbi:MAG: Uma2 family endonuclease [Isosphaeraceae bacterium]
MSTIASPPPMASPSLPFLPIRTGQRIVFRGVSRDAYESLSRAMSEGDHIRLAYDGKDLEIMVTSHLHENWKELLARIVNAVTMWRRIAYVSNGEATWETTVRGLQADLSYYFDPEKIRTAREALARESMVQADYPNPDLAIEIDMSGPRIDRPAIYADLGVAEVWRLGRKGFVIEQLQADGSYAPVEESRFLGIRADVILEWLSADDRFDEPAWNLRLNQWAMGLGPRP